MTQKIAEDEYEPSSRIGEKSRELVIALKEKINGTA